MQLFVANSLFTLALISSISVASAVSTTITTSDNSKHSTVSISDNISEIASPYTVLKTTGTRLFSRISANQKTIAKFPHLMRDIIEEELMPSIDYRYISYRILGKGLNNISTMQRDDFVEAMRHYLVRTYSNTLSKYKNQDVIFESEKPTKGKRIVGVKTHIVGQGSPTIQVVFQMRENKKTKQWKIFDMTVEGISLLSAKQIELNNKIVRQGIDHVILELSALAKQR